MDASLLIGKTKIHNFTSHRMRLVIQEEKYEDFFTTKHNIHFPYGMINWTAFSQAFVVKICSRMASDRSHKSTHNKRDLWVPTLWSIQVNRESSHVPPTKNKIHQREEVDPVLLPNEPTEVWQNYHSHLGKLLNPRPAQPRWTTSKKTTSWVQQREKNSKSKRR